MPSCNMEVQTPAERKMSIAQKRELFNCDKQRLSCSNCPLYKPDKLPKKPLKKLSKK